MIFRDDKFDKTRVMKWNLNTSINPTSNHIPSTIPILTSSILDSSSTLSTPLYNIDMSVNRLPLNTKGILPLKTTQSTLLISIAE